MKIPPTRTPPNVPPQTLAEGTVTKSVTNSAAANDARAKFRSGSEAMARLAKQQPPIPATPGSDVSIEGLRKAAQEGKLALLPVVRQLELLGINDVDLSAIFDKGKIAQDLNKALGGDVDAWARVQHALGGHQPTAEEKKKFAESPVANWLSAERQMLLMGQPTRPPGHIERGRQIKDALNKARTGDMSGLDALGEKNIKPGAGGDIDIEGLFGLDEMISSREVSVPGLGTITPKGGDTSQQTKTESPGGSPAGGKTAGEQSISAETGGARYKGDATDALASADAGAGTSSETPGTGAGAGAADGAKGDTAGSAEQKTWPVHHKEDDGEWVKGTAHTEGEKVVVEWEDGRVDNYSSEEAYNKTGFKGSSEGNTTIEVEKPPADDSSSTERRDPDYLEATRDPSWDMRLSSAPKKPATAPWEENPVLGVGDGDTVDAKTNPNIDPDQALHSTGVLTRHEAPVRPHHDPDAAAGPVGTRDDPRTQERR